MPNPYQRAEIGRSAYAAGSSIATRNKRLALAKRVNAARAGTLHTDGIVARGRTTSAADYVMNGDLSGKQIDSDREPFLLVGDPYNAGNFNTIPIYDCETELEKRTGKCVLVLHCGDVLVPADTLIYWK
ncbi:TPA: hypothetical protein ACYLN4_007272 [Burkholderia lata]